MGENMVAASKRFAEAFFPPDRFRGRYAEIQIQ
jgi:hypothetical protein